MIRNYLRCSTKTANFMQRDAKVSAPVRGAAEACSLQGLGGPRLSMCVGSAPFLRDWLVKEVKICERLF